MPGFPTAPAVQTVTDKLATIAPELGNVPGYYVYLKDPIAGTIYESATVTDSGGNWSIAGVTMGLTYQYSYGVHPNTAYPFKGAYVASNPATQGAAPFALTGAAGAVAASRWVGATVSGAPLSGTYAVGDFIIDQSGVIWICTVAGTPGTWVRTFLGSADANGNLLIALANKVAGEDATNDVVKVASEVLEQTIGLPALTTIFCDSIAIIPLSRVKTIYLVVTTPITYTSGQATWQPFISRQAFAAAGGAASALTVAQILLGAAQNLGASGTSLPNGTYRLSPATIADLQWPDAMVGVEFHFPSAPGAGVAALYLESAP